MRFERVRRRLNQQQNDAGFSIVEMAVTVAVLSIVMSVILATVINVVNQSKAFKDRTQEQADTRLAVDTMVREMRQAYTGKSDLDSVVAGATALTMTFYSPDRDPTAFRLRKITYTLNTTTDILTRSVVTSSNTSSTVVGTNVAWNFGGQTTFSATVLTGVISTSMFTYKNQNDGTPTTALPLRAVVIDLVVDLSPTTSPTPQTYHTQVDLRVTDNDGS